MTLLAPAFAAFSPASAAPGTLSIERRRAEVERELQHRRESYPRLVERQTITDGQATVAIRMFEAIAADLRDGDVTGARPDAPPWSLRLQALRDEIAFRRRAYPRQIERAILTPVDARRQLELLEAIQWRYWARLDHWYTGPTPTPPAEAARILAHEDAVDALGGLAAALDQRLTFPAS